MQRDYLNPFILKDLSRKIVFISGPRQAGKTTLSKALTPEYDYLNYDSTEDRILLLKKTWDRQKQLIIFDELHKLKNWKSWLKGIYDKEGVSPQLLVTGSAKLDTYKKVGDSLAGRFFSYRLHPFDIKELSKKFPEQPLEQIFEQLLLCGGFPEPYLAGDSRYYQRWRKSHMDIILRQDLLDLEKIHNISQIETLVELLRERVGSTTSSASLARDLQCDIKTIQKWLIILENLYVIFRVTPYSKNIARAILKEPKFYFYDIGAVKGTLAQKIENLTACSLLKELHFLEDTQGLTPKLHYLKLKDGKELDFFISLGDSTQYLLEVKTGKDILSSQFKAFSHYFPKAKKIQLVHQLSREKTYPDNTEIRKLAPWLAKINLNQ